ncbi:MAG: hypothetical protein ACUVV4_03215 [Candidatus Bathyarchaeia archaeon]
MRTYNIWKVEKYYSELNLEEIKAYSGEAEGFSKDVGSIQITVESHSSETTSLR